MKIAACIIVRDEEDAIEQWILYHHLMGFDTIIVVDHRSADKTGARASATRAIVDVRLARLDADAAYLQAELYLQVCRQWASEFDWIGFFDIDEYLVSPGEAKCGDLLRQHAETAAIALPWLLFGSSGHDAKPAGLLVEDYTRRAPYDFRPNHHVKSIVRPAKVTACANPHCFEVDGPTRLPSGGAVIWESPGKLLHYPDAETWRLHHYFTRSRSHWADRMKRGQLSQLQRTWTDFNAYDRNEILDDSAARHGPALRRLLAEIGAASDEMSKLQTTRQTR